MTDQPEQFAFLGLGSNLGDRRALLDGACDHIIRLPDTRLIARSPIYETPPMGPQDQGAYLNMAVQLATKLDPTALLTQLQQIETGLGRAMVDARQHWGPREIDIDLLLFDDAVIDQPGLTVPHPGIADRWFVLRPLADLAPEFKHPTLGRTIAELLAGISQPDAQEVQS